MVAAVDQLKPFPPFKREWPLMPEHAIPAPSSGLARVRSILDIHRTSSPTRKLIFLSPTGNKQYGVTRRSRDGGQQFVVLSGD